MSQKVRFSDWMSDSDAGMWHIEADPKLRSTIVSVWVLDRMPDLARFEETLALCVDRIPRLRQRVVEDPFDVAPPRWEDDPHFDPAFHLRRSHLGGEAELSDLFAFAEPLAMQSFDKDRPLWELHLVDGLSGGRAGVVMRLHHAVSDGVGLVRMTSGLVERSREGRPAAERRPVTSRVSRLRSTPEAIRDAVRERARIDLDRGRRAGRALLGGIGGLLTRPVETLQNAGDTVASVGRLLRPVTEPLSPVMRERSTSLRLRGFSVPLDELKRAGKAADGSINDAFVAAVGAGLRRYHEHFGKPVDELRMTMPINLREGEKGDQAGNQFAPARFVVPVGIADPVRRMKAVQAGVREQRSEPALPFADDVTAILNRLPRAAARALAGGMLKSIDFVTSNVPGPRFPIYMSGAKIEQMIPFGPPAGAAVNITLYSYDGVCNIGVNADPAAVTDPDLLVECLKKGVDEVLAVC